MHVKLERVRRHRSILEARLVILKAIATLSEANV